MTQMLALFPLVAPLALVLASLLARREAGARPRRLLIALRVASVVAALAAVATCIVAATSGTLTAILPGLGALGFALRIDALSAVMFGLVTFLGIVLVEYSRAYLDGDPRHGWFLAHLAQTVAAVQLLVLSGTLVQLAVMWTLTSLSLHRLLLFYPDRPAAVVAGRKKFVVARLSDVALAAAAVLLATTFGTSELGELFARINARLATGAVPAVLPLVAGLIVAAAALKSAQFPTHGWLAEVMETPTPVSALLHAGILNGGVFLMARLSPVLMPVPGALHAMVLIGGFTALFASLVMVTQPTIKGTFAYSSAAHMGFMMLLCGLGSWPLAMMHLVAHSFYKAHAFLSAGSAVEVMRASHVSGEAGSGGVLAILAAFAVAVATVVGVGALVGVSVTERPVSLGLASILAIGLTQLLAQATGDRPGLYVFGRTLLASAGTALAFFVLERAAIYVLRGSVPVVSLNDPVTIALMTGVIIAFALAILWQLLLPRVVASHRWAGFWVLVRNGLYANVLFDRLVGALRPTNRAQTMERA